ncbi:DUF4199 domain-containing protein [Dokdonia sp. Hel_I_53]|uniref:DUF4199 domain-containing protein n=1 Tax=Dokdonia sp. Hel_I_53 TaxID=1566287 RepID=UPI00119AB861|nr:DUF4199 domain-containing protein [Dokdonia sp. Hel_I_53]TVZ51603.1 uncharacterized protein DUF4199 [Dokdonia sp. Hel_I_53]
MDTNTTSTKDVMLKYGLLLGIIMILFQVILYVTNNFLAPHWSLGVLSFVIMIAVTVMGLKTFKKANGGFLKLGQALKIGLGIALISGLIGVVWTLVLTQVLEPNYSELALGVVRDQVLEQYPDMTETQIEQTLSFQENFTKLGFMIPISILFSLFFGFIISLIAGLIMRKDNPYADA